MAVITTADKAIKKVNNGNSLMVGGFLGVGSPLKLIDNLAEKDVEELTFISVVGGYPGGEFDIGKLAPKKQIKKFIGAHIGTDPKLVKAYNDGDIEVEFNPMGTFIERIRAAGGGLGAVVTPVGLGTEVEELGEKINLFGSEYLAHPPLSADVALIKAVKADKKGNLMYEGTSINTNTTMATAADIVIAEVDEIVEVGEIEPNDIGTQGIFVDYIVEGYSKEERKDIFEELWEKSGKFNK
ncbi:CoA transferase subunit A [Natroniella sp. ANB-PHB2]|uniref:CoA transferase subunit A n=1 Tax=Natroniella sp. ANB-PHB2 TaxID=3384444 RepID=UPI0038D37693